ncbi:MAG: DUF1570 domain-containing protein [Planctomycetota bacterium]
MITAHRTPRHLAWLALVAAACAPPAARGEKPAAPLRTYPTPRYVIRTDITDEDVIREAAIRMTTMAAEYDRRTRNFGRRVRKRLPFYLFAGQSAYRDAGGVKGSAGLFNGRALLAVADVRSVRTGRLWHTVQHEAWHQYVFTVAGPRVPIWANEGMAEYFGHAIWTGDGYVTGVAPPPKLARLKKLIRADKLLEFTKMLSITPTEWRQGLNQRNYLQAWAMVHFLAHAEDGKYRDAFGAYIAHITDRRMPWRKAYVRSIGGHPRQFRAEFDKWWLAREPDDTGHLYIRATVATLTSFLGRAILAGQSFETAEEFFAAAEAGELEHPEGQWLPPSLLQDVLPLGGKLSTWRLTVPPARIKLVLQRDDGTTFSGTYTARRGKVRDVDVTVTRDASRREPR